MLASSGRSDKVNTAINLIFDRPETAKKSSHFINIKFTSFHLNKSVNSKSYHSLSVVISPATKLMKSTSFLVPGSRPDELSQPGALAALLKVPQNKNGIEYIRKISNAT